MTDYHRPTLTFPTGAYNATQVRLYGIQGTGSLSYYTHPASFGDSGVTVETPPPVTNSEEQNKKDLDDLKQRLDPFGNIDVAKIIQSGFPWPWPFPLPTRLVYQISIEMKQFGTIVLSTATQGGLLSAGIIVGYAYEGHCYDLPKPKIMLLPALPRELPLDDCGYDLKNDLVAAPPIDNGYRVWIVDKLDQCVELEMNQGFVEQLVLDANLPGKRSPTMYGAKMLLGHRNGRLTDS